MLSTILLSLVLAPTVLSSGEADPVNNWPQWRGPDRDGISRETDWKSTGKEATVWTAQVGLGYSCFAITDGRLFTAGWDEKREEDDIYCLDANTGEELWRHSYGAKKWDLYHDGGTNCTPSVDGKDVYVLNREGRYSLLDAETGEVRWEVDLVEKYGLELPTWGFSASPLILEDQVILHVGKLISFPKGKSKPIWKTKDYGHAYATPTATQMGGKDVLAVMGGKSLVMLDMKGKELAQFEWETKYDVNAASVVAIDDERLWISSGYGHGGAMVVFTGDELIELWGTKAMKNHMATCIKVGEYIYGIDEGVLKCLDFDGKEMWAKRGIGKGALSAAGDRLLVHTAGGELCVAQANPKEYTELSRTKVTKGGVCWTMPILVNGLIYLRSSTGELVARDHR